MALPEWEVAVGELVELRSKIGATDEDLWLRYRDHGAHIKTVQELMGHESLDSTNRYLKVRPYRLPEAIAKWDLPERS